MPATSRSVISAALLAGMTTALVAAMSPMGAQAKVVSEDEDAFVQIFPAKGHNTGWGTAWANQVISTKDGQQSGNVMTGWMTVYGLASKTRYTLAVLPGQCGVDRDAVSSTVGIKTNGLGGWQGKYHVNVRKPTTWVVRGGYRIDVRKKNGGVKACGRLRDDPDVGN